MSSSASAGAGGVIGPGHVVDGHGVEWVTTAAAVRLLGPDVTAAMVYDWARPERQLVTDVRRVGGRSWYRLDQLQDAEHRTRTRGRPRSA